MSRGIVTHRRTFVKATIYRVWIFVATYSLLVWTGHSLKGALVPTIAVNSLLAATYYLYDRMWMRISWGIEYEESARTGKKNKRKNNKD